MLAARAAISRWSSSSRSPAELEVRAGHGEQDALLRQTVFTSLAAETLAETWRAAAKAQGFQPFEG